MQKILYPPPNEIKYYRKKTRIDNRRSGSFDHYFLEIYDKETNTKLYDYFRARPSPGIFFPFKNKNDEWFTLYAENSKDEISVMSLPSCKLVAVAQFAGYFFPVDAFIPFVSSWHMDWGEDHEEKHKKPNRFEISWEDPQENIDITTNYLNTSWHHLDFAFISGGLYGDRSHLRLLDLSKMHEGKIELSRPFTPDAVPCRASIINITEVHLEDGTIPRAYGVSVNGNFYRFAPDSYKIQDE